MGVVEGLTWTIRADYWAIHADEAPEFIPGSASLGAKRGLQSAPAPCSAAGPSLGAAPLAHPAPRQRPARSVPPVGGLQRGGEAPQIGGGQGRIGQRPQLLGVADRP